MSFKFQLLTQLDSIHKHVKQEDIDQEKIRKWVLQKLKEDQRDHAIALKDMDELYQKLFHEVLEVINEFKLLRPHQIKQEIEDTFGDKGLESTGSTKVLSITKAAEKLGISRSTLYDKINKGIINTTLDGKIHEDEIMRYLIGK